MSPQCGMENAVESRPAALTCGPIGLGSEVSHFCGRKQVLEGASRLAGLAQNAGQGEALLHLDYLLSVPYFGQKRPHLLVLSDSTGEACAAAFVLEHRVLGVPTRIFIPVDDDGFLTIVAPPERRAEAASALADYLLKNGALSVLLTIYSAPPPGSTGRSSWIARNDRELRRTLALMPTVDETLATIGTRSRRNLRNFARKVVTQLGAVFVPDAEITEDDFVAFSHNCLYPVREWVSRSRYRTLKRLDHTFLSGLRSGDGTWLSLVGGRRDATSAIIDWQLNRNGLPAYSIGTAMRYFQIEHEVERGIQFLQFSGGTPHSIQSAFLHESATDLLWTRGAVFHKTLQLACRVLRRKNVISAMMTATAEVPE